MTLSMHPLFRRVILNERDAGPRPCVHPAEALQTAMVRAMAAHTRPQGCVDYTALGESREFAAARAAAEGLRLADPARLTSRAERLAFWINVYNALVLHAVVALRVRKRVTEVWNFFGRVSYRVGADVFSLDEIEHGVLRGNRRRLFPPLRPFGAGDPRRALAFDRPDPRIHFAVTCAVRSCPPVAVYRAAAVDAQLDLASRNFVNQEIVVDPGGSLVCSRIFKWYADDFGGRDALRSFLLRHLDDGPVRAAVAAAAPCTRFNAYDWRLQHAPCD
jgi:hypothetical protein